MKPTVLQQTVCGDDDEEYGTGAGDTLGTPFLGKKLTYDSTVFNVESDNHPAIRYEDWRQEGEAAEKGEAYGLPHRITGNPLGCTCSEAFLHAIGELKDGQIECDYMCDSGWHNYVVWQVHEKKKTAPKKQHIKIDKFGQPMKDDGFVAGELETL